MISPAHFASFTVHEDPVESFDEAHILRQIRNFVSGGFSEVVICVDLGSYESPDTENESRLALASFLEEDL